MDIEALRYKNSIQIDKLLMNYPLGVRIKFEHNVKQWENSKWDNNYSDSNLSTSSSLFVSTKSLDPVPAFTIDEVLKRSTHGSMIINYYTNLIKT